MAKAGKRVGDVRPPVEECIQYWDGSWMEAQLRSAYEMKKHRLMQNRGVVLSYDENRGVARRSMWAAFAPVLALLALLLLAWLAMDNYWLSGGEKGVIGRALEGESVEATQADSASDAVKGDRSGAVGGPLGVDPFAVDLTTPNDGGPMGIPEAGVPGG